MYTLKRFILQQGGLIAHSCIHSLPIKWNRGLPKFNCTNAKQLASQIFNFHCIHYAYLVYFLCYLVLPQVFIVTSYFNVLQHSMTAYVPKAITLGAEALISIRRLEVRFLNGTIHLQFLKCCNKNFTDFYLTYFS